MGDIQDNKTDSLYYLLKGQSKVESYRMKSQRYFEQFLIVGVDQESLSKIQGEEEFNRVAPKTLYQNPDLQLQNKEARAILNERSKVVKDFCFPDGVYARKLNYDPDIRTDENTEAYEIIQDILYKQKNYREQTFIFTLDANEEVGEAGDNYMHCMCVTIDEIMRR